MTFLHLHDEKLTARLSTQGGCIVDLWFDDVPVLRPYHGAPDGLLSVVDAACFPFVPYCGRIEGNEFFVDNARYTLQANTTNEQYCLHGDGWLSDWSLLMSTAERLSLGLSHSDSAASPYHYEATLEVSVSGGILRMVLSVQNCGNNPLPFGLGFHPYFPLTNTTTIEFHAEGVRDEREDHLPGHLQAIPAELDFSSNTAVPDRFMHLGYEGWAGRVLVKNPALGVAVDMRASPECSRLQLFTPGLSASEHSDRGYVCAEPMTHTCNAHRMPGHHGLQRLAPGESMQVWMHIGCSVL